MSVSHADSPRSSTWRYGDGGGSIADRGGRWEIKYTGSCPRWFVSQLHRLDNYWNECSTELVLSPERIKELKEKYPQIFNEKYD